MSRGTQTNPGGLTENTCVARIGFQDWSAANLKRPVCLSRTVEIIGWPSLRHRFRYRWTGSGNPPKSAYENLPADEREPFKQIYDEVTQHGDGYFLRAVLNPNIIAMSKTGSSQATCKRHAYKEFFSQPVSDLALFSHILHPGEYTKPYHLKFMTDASFGVEKRGWSASDANLINERYSSRDGLNVIFFKPWPYKKAFRIEFGYEAFPNDIEIHKLLTIIRDETQHHTIIEPVAQMYADRLAKQVSAISRMYGSINMPIFSDILFPTRT